jgi:hypothetical protein
MKTSAIRDGFQHRAEEPRFFVRTVGQDEPDWTEGYRSEIQFLDQNGCSGYELFLMDDEEAPADLPYDLPTAVVDAARAMRSGGDYLSSDGRSMPPF